jgi:flavin reductase (DIM6/NTAB) family NADH-FMN oxidoreductase RutF
MTEHDVQRGVGAFEQIVAMLDYPMFVVTTRAGDQCSGCRTYRVAVSGATHLAVHLLSDEQRDLARLFGSETGAAAWFAGRILHRFDLGDHVGHLTEPVAGSAPERFGPLVACVDVKDLGRAMKPDQTR